MSVWRDRFSIMSHFAAGFPAMHRLMKHTPLLRKGLLFVLVLIGSGTVLYSAGAAGLRMLRNHAPDNVQELLSPDGRYRIVIANEVAGFPGAFCVRQVYVVDARDTVDRNDEDNLVYAGACDGLSSIQWDGARIRGIVDTGAAVVGVRNLTLRQYGANGRVQLRWTGR